MISPLAFRRQYEPVWSELEKSLSRRPLKDRRMDRIRDIGRLYREVTSHLSYARTYFPDHDVTRELNSLAGRAHLVLYGRKGGQWDSIWKFVAGGFPFALRRSLPFFLFSVGVMLFGIVIGYVAVTLAPGAIYTLLPSSFVQQFHPATVGPHAVDSPLMSSLIMTNNIRVSLYAFIGAFTLGIWTIWVLYQNGLILGALAAMFGQAHRSVVFWSLIVPHGVTELTAIAVAGTAGFLVGYRWLVPGRVTRMESLRLGALDAAKLVLGMMGMLVIAGIIEGFLTPSHLSVAFKYGFAALTAVFWILYFSIGGRNYARQ